MDSTSSFAGEQPAFPDAELLAVSGTTCQCYRVKRYGKLHFLKRLKPELRTHPQYVAALQKEFETGYSLDHPNLVRYLSKTDDGILMDYVDGETLSQFAEHHPDYFKSRKNADRFLRQLLSVVGYLHSHQVVHLDLKPANILMTRVGNDVKLVDLGYCYADCYTDTTGRTDKYAAPEQLDGSAKVDARTDIYAIGRILQTLPCAPYYNKVIRRCTAKNMEARYASTDEILQSLHSRWPWWMAVLALMFMAALGIYNVMNSSSDVTEATAVYPQESTQHSQSGSVTNREPTTHATPDAVTSPPEKERPQLAHEEVKTEQSVQPTEAHSEAAKEAPATVQYEDTLALRRELQRLIGPRFKQTLGHYSDSIYNRINQERFSQEWIDFEESLIPLYTQVWEKFKDRVSKHTMESEWCQTIQYYRVPQFWQMMRNEPGHDSFYDDKAFEYYKFPC